jgi:hypothetical protein
MVARDRDNIGVAGKQDDLNRSIIEYPRWALQQQAIMRIGIVADFGCPGLK